MDSPDQTFGPFRLDLNAGQLRRGDEVIPLRRKTWMVLCYLVAHPGRLVSKEELIAHIWEGGLVSDTVTNVSVAELRHALNDDRVRPRYIETVYGRGFRFLASVESVLPSLPPRGVPGLLGAGAVAAGPGSTFVGRGDELAEMRRFLSEEDAHARVLLVGGEAGIGKSALVRACLAEFAPSIAGGIALGQGQCPAQIGRGFPFLPVLGAVGNLCATNAGAAALLASVAPSWAARLNGVVAAKSRAVSARPAVDGELDVEELISFLCKQGRVILTFEDLHWADHATLDFIVVLGEHPGLGGCRVLGTYRAAEAIAAGHPVVRAQRELQRYGRAVEIDLAGLDQAAVSAYLSAEFSGAHCPAELAFDLLTRSAGNPLFLCVSVDHLIRSGALLRGDDDCIVAGERYAALSDEIPESLRELVEQRVAERSEPERRLLGVLSVGGLESDAAAAAAALAEPLAEIDTACDSLARGSIFLQRTGETVWPDGSVSGRYGFRHPLYQRVLYDGLPPAVRIRAHQRIAEALIAAFGEESSAVAAVVAEHFDRGRLATQAVSYHMLAARVASEQNASSDAIVHLHRALDLQKQTDDPEREASILSQLALTLPAVEGITGADLAALFTRARSLHARETDAFAGALTLTGLAMANLLQGKVWAAEALAREMTQIPATAAMRAVPWLAAVVMSAVHYHRGDIGAAVNPLRMDLGPLPEDRHLGPIDIATAWDSLQSVILWQAGRPQEARQRAARAVAAAEKEHPFNLLIALQAVAVVESWCGHGEEAMAAAVRLRAAAEEQGINEVVALARIIEGCVWSERGEERAADAIEAGLQALRNHGAVMMDVYLLTLSAESWARSGRLLEARSLLAEGQAKIAAGAERYYEPEIHRLLGEITLLEDEPSADSFAERCFRVAYRIAEQQGSRSLTLRSALSLARLWRARGDEDGAIRIVRQTLAAIEGGQDSRDVAAAHDALGHRDGVCRSASGFHPG